VVGTAIIFTLLTLLPPKTIQNSAIAVDSEDLSYKYFSLRNIHGPRSPFLSTAMPDHHNLPEELLENILWRLKLSTDDAARDENRVLTNTLLSCLLASRTLNRLAKPVLYHTANAANLFSIVHHLAHNPTVASQVRELSVDEHSSQYVGVMGINDDRQWPEYLRDRLSACQSCWTERHRREEINTYGFRLPVANLILMVCTNIHTLVLHDKYAEPQAISHHFIEDCMDLGYDDPNAPLASLRNVVLQYPTVPTELVFLDDDEMEPDFESEGYVWFFWLVQLPQIESVTVHRLLKNSSDILMLSSSSLKRLKLTDPQEPLDTDRLEGILEASPMLECLDATWKFSYMVERGMEWSPDIEWAALGAAVTKHGSKLQRLRLDNSAIHFLPGKPSTTSLNLASLNHLRSLTLPVEALLSEPAGEYSVPATDEAGQDDDDEFRDLHAPGQGVNTPTASLRQILPHSLQRLRLIDDWHLWADAIRLDMELRDLLLDPRFSELRSIRIRRKIPWSKHVKDLGWHEFRHGPYWNVLLRP
jgi:hypothetical protein